MEFLDRVDSAKFWLLDLVYKGIFPIHILVDDQLELVVNKSTGHGLDRTELVDALLMLFEEEMLIAQLYKNPDDFPMRITPTQQDIENALAGKLDLHYGLTSLGGEQWEKLSKPNWNLYISGRLEREEVSFSGSDRQIVEQYLPSLRYSSQQEIVSGSEIWEHLVPWQATYWKTLPSGWQVTCQTRETNEYLGNPMPSEYQEWFNKIQNWYVNPFHEAN
ncbi:hypothetical protein V2H45_25290 [Tumidithrix elongata RA019]|uniref:Uncharacterized protein n=1 Tax=Tumidithrix elongata BACA0141 TaxID=2716417 RepID=A0AAW9PZX9_9CYAN|nr:hypothetical protein [Tumidithrix elongata RA019]